MVEIKIVDISDIGLASTANVTEESKRRIASEIAKSFSDIGFVYVRNHGIEQSVIEEAFRASLSFFNLSEDAKFENSKGPELQGWVSQGREIFDQDEEGKIAELEIREAFDMKNMSDSGLFPDTHCPHLRTALSQLGRESLRLTNRLLQCISLALDREESYLPNILRGMLSKGTSEEIDNATTLRTILYPPIRDDEIQPGVIRCGEHSDYGIITLLYQDSTGGLEAKTCEGTWVPANPIPGCILINVGDLLESLTCGNWPATRHRVRIPQEEIKRKCLRQSMAFFVYPDNAVVISPLSGPDPRYPPITAIQYLEKRFGATFGERLKIGE